MQKQEEKKLAHAFKLAGLIIVTVSLQALKS